FGTGEVNSSKPVRILPIAVAFDGVTYVDLPSLASSDVEFTPDVNATGVTVKFDLVDVQSSNLAAWQDDEFVPSSELTGLSAQDILSEYFEGVEITLPPEELDKLYKK